MPQDYVPLPTGASTIPILGNLVLSDLDASLLEVAREHGLHYSRYVDDITFSGTSDFCDGLPAHILKLVSSHGYVPHLRKTRYEIGIHEVTGVKIKRHRLSPTNSQRKRLSAKKKETQDENADSVAGMKQYMQRVGVLNKRK
ncbi:MAG: hypothetical protein OKBPIBMD_02050 [Chlorobi bacterium]|nr:MAG: hypothetical protein UZ06_CHB003001004 [Chlorobi bacterium OLB6]MBV6464560.1 hypothetical protein [Chlorobiota bacterium]NOG67310.1 hypothetical protein [Chlorobiota bacterium]